MGSDLNVCANIIRFLLVLVNILFVILGLILIGVGSWLIATNSSFTFITDNSIIGGAALLIIAGIVTVIICATGIVGAIFKLRPILVVYALVLLVIVILEIVGGILGFVFSGVVVGGLMDGSLRAIQLYNPNPDSSNATERDATTAVDTIQNTLSCCGYNNFTDWIVLNPNAVLESQLRPPGRGCAECTVGTDENCVPYNGTINVNNRDIQVSFNVTSLGCVGRLEGSLVLIGSVGGALGVVFGILEISGIIFSLIVCCCITSARRQEVV